MLSGTGVAGPAGCGLTEPPGGQAAPRAGAEDCTDLALALNSAACFLEMRSCYVAQAGLNLLASGILLPHPPGQQGRWHAALPPAACTPFSKPLTLPEPQFPP